MRWHTSNPARRGTAPAAPSGGCCSGRGTWCWIAHASCALPPRAAAPPGPSRAAPATSRVRFGLARWWHVHEPCTLACLPDSGRPAHPPRTAQASIRAAFLRAPSAPAWRPARPSRAAWRTLARPPGRPCCRSCLRSTRRVRMCACAAAVRLGLSRHAHALAHGIHGRPHALIAPTAHTQARYPDYMQELQGIADGAQLPRDTIFLLNLRAEFPGSRAGLEQSQPANARLLRGEQEGGAAGSQAAGAASRGEGCSDVLVYGGEGGEAVVLVGHNEDVGRDAVGRLYLVRVQTVSVGRWGRRWSHIQLQSGGQALLRAPAHVNAPPQRAPTVRRRRTTPGWPCATLASSPPLRLEPRTTWPSRSMPCTLRNCCCQALGATSSAAPS